MVRTIADGDCALGVMCLKLGKPRTLASRKGIRHECIIFARRQAARRALIAMLNVLGELKEHLEPYELDAAGVVLMTRPQEEIVLAINHGDGVSLDVPTDIALPTARDYSPDEISAMAWKCRMQQSSPDIISGMIQRLPEKCILEMVEEFRERAVGVVTKSATSIRYFVITRHAFKGHKDKAVQHCLDWAKVSLTKSMHFAQMKVGIIPRGWFVACVRRWSNYN